MILIYPPAVKPCEPPAGIAKLSAVLSRHGIKIRVLDANLEGLFYCMQRPKRPLDTWTKRSFRNLSKNLAALKSRHAYHNFDRYKRAVMDVNRILKMSAGNKNVTLGLANYQDREYSPLRSRDLIRAAENPENNPFYPYFEKRLRGLLEKEQPSVVGFSLNYLSQALCTFAMVGFLREKCPELTLVLGGGLVTSWIKRPGWRHPFQGLVDHLVAGPGEHRLLSLSGVAEIKKNHCPPDYEALPLNDYLAPGFILPYSASSGCPWNRCSFCPERAEGSPYIPVPVNRVISDLDAIATKRKPVLIHFLDNSMSVSLLEHLSQNPPGVPWYGFSRINRHLTDIEFCLDLKRSGCVMLKLGLESGDQGVLDKMQKGIDLETASLAFRTLKKAGIATYVYLLFGTPWETETEARKTLEFVGRHSNEINFLNLALFNMPCYGPEVREVETNKFYEGDLTLYTNFSHPKGWGRKPVRQFLDNEFRRNRDISAIIKKNPPFFTSNHAPFFVKEYDWGVAEK